MALSGGGDRTQLRGLRPDGNVQHEIGGERIVGNHRGTKAALNWVNPRPGTVVQYADENANPGSVLAARQRGWWVADTERDGRPAYELMGLTPGDASGADPNRHPLYRGLVPLVTTEENFRRIQEERERENRARVSPTNLGFIENASEQEAALSERGGPTRFAVRGHGNTRYGDGRVLEQETPRGVLREG